MLAIGEKLRDARQMQNMSLRELASRAEVSPSLLSQIENGKANPSVVTLYNIAMVLDVPLDYFFPADAQQDGDAGKPAAADAPTASQMRAMGGAATLPAGRDSSLPVVCPDTRATIELMNGVRWQRLTPASEPGVEFLEIHYEVGASSGAAMSRHVGREFGLVLEGELLLELGFDKYTLRPGDSVIFDSFTPHRLTNTGAVPLRAVWVVLSRGA